jgi:hypothetical protein
MFDLGGLELFVLVMINLVPVALNAYLARKKARRMAVWMLLGLFFSFFSTIVLVLLKPRQRDLVGTGHMANRR